MHFITFLKPPVPVEKWKGIRSAKNFGSPCIQYDAMIYGNIIGEENCLFLSVYTPKVTANQIYDLHAE